MVLPRILPLHRRANAESPQSTSPKAEGTRSAPTSKFLKQATRTRRYFTYLSSFLFLLCLLFLILVEIGMVANRRVLTSVYFIKIDMRNIIPRTVPQSVLINSIAQTLGLHDFYQVGLWNFCEGYGDRVTNCSDPELLYWFDPVEIILDQLLAGATRRLPLSYFYAS